MRETQCPSNDCGNPDNKEVVCQRQTLKDILDCRVTKLTTASLVANFVPRNDNTLEFWGARKGGTRMKKFLVFLCAIFICTFAFAHSVEWYVDDSLYQTTTCDAGDSITPPTAPTKYGYSFAGWELLYTQLEYIQSTGTQYIDTGYAWASQNRRVFLDVTKTSNIGYTHLFGSTNLQGAVADRYDLNPYMAEPSGNIATYVGNDSYGNIAIPLSTRCKYEFDLKSDKTLSISYNSEVVYTSTSVANIPTTQASVYLFHVHILGTSLMTYNPFVGNIYAYKMWDDGILVRNFIPCRRNSDNAIGMYDTVTNTFFTNAGRGEFIAGPEVGGL